MAAGNILTSPKFPLLVSPSVFFHASYRLSSQVVSVFLLSLARQPAMGDIGISQEQYAGSYPIIEPDPTVSIYFPRTDTEWSIGPAISIQRYHEQHPGPMAESLVEYIATRVVEEPKKFEPRTPRRGRKRIGMLPGGQPAEIPLELEPVCDYPAIATLRIWHE